MGKETQRSIIMNLLSWIGFSALLSTALYFKLGCKGRTILWVLYRRAWHRACQRKVGEKKERREEPEEPEENGGEDEWEEAAPKCD